MKNLISKSKSLSIKSSISLENDNISGKSESLSTKSDCISIRSEGVDRPTIIHGRELIHAKEFKGKELYPRIPETNVNWVDIGDEFFKCSNDLALGELLHDKSFSLLEAMSAIEMMDPKMDAGLLSNRSHHKILNFEQSVEAGTLKVADFTDKELVGITDAIMSSFVSWLEGHSLAQTVFTNLYMHKPFDIKDQTLKIFCITVYKILELVREFIQSAGVFEDEDFQPVMYGYSIPHTPEYRVKGLLKEVEDELYKKTKMKNPSLIKSLYFANPDPPLAVYVRVKFVRHFYTLLTLLKKHKSNDDNVPDYAKIAAQTIDIIAVIHRSIAFGSKYRAIGIEPLINQRLLPPTFPRYVETKSIDQAYKFLEEFLDRIKILVKVQNMSAFHSAVDFFIDFSRRKPCVLSRSILQILYFGNNLTAHPIGDPNITVLTNISFVDVLKESCKNFIAPPSLIYSPKFSSGNMEQQFLQCREYVDNFFLRCVKPFSNMIQIYGHNLARQRDKLALLLEELTTLQDEAEWVDTFLHQQYMSHKISQPHLACFSTWILYHILQVMIMYLSAGFELELYSSYEYCYIYWYMYEFVYTWLISALNRAETFVSSTENENFQNKNRANKNKKPKKKRNSKYYEHELLYYQAIQNMCGGYYKGLLGLQRDKLIKLPSNEFSQEPIRFEHRFAPFRNLVTPPPASYKQFLNTTNQVIMNGKAENQYLYRGAVEHFLKARVEFENVTTTDKDLSGLLHVSKRNFVVFKLLADGHTTNTKVPIEFDFTAHSLFPSIKIQVCNN